MAIDAILKARQETLELPGFRMDYVAFGGGTRDMVLIPGLSLRSMRGTARPLAMMYRLFARDYRVWVFDRRAEVPEGITIRALAEDLALGMKRLGIEGADVMGVSMGGMIGQYLAIDHPELVRRLALAVTLSRPNDTLRRAVDGWVDMMERGDCPGIVEDMLTRMYSRQYVERYGKLFPLLLKAVKLDEPGRFIRLAKATLTCEAYDELDAIRCPVLVLGGEEDRIVTAQASREIAERLGCAIHMYEGLGHSAYEEAKDFNRRVLDFFSGEAPRNPPVVTAL